MLLDEIFLSFPLMTSVVGEKWLRHNAWCEEYISSRLDCYEQLERDLRRLDSKVGLQFLRKCYQSLLRDRKSLGQPFMKSTELPWCQKLQVALSFMFLSVSQVAKISTPGCASTEVLSTLNVRPARMNFPSTGIINWCRYNARKR